MNVSNKRYADLVKRRQKKPRALRNCLCAFLVGGGVCTVGELLSSLYSLMGTSEEEVATLTSVTLIVAAELLTATGLFYKIAKFAGAGTLVPITGFANAVASTAIDGKSEGYLCGVGVKIFTVAGPVILYGTAASVVYGVIYWLTLVI